MAIIGEGNIAKVLNDRDGAIFFASGVSNSSTKDRKAFEREFNLLARQPQDKCLFYFSTISRYYGSSEYVIHKIVMERAVKKWFENYNIIRIGNLEGDTNPNTFLNALRAKRDAGEPVEILDEYRYMISKEQLLLLTDNLPLIGKNEINAFGTMAKVKDLL